MNDSAGRRTSHLLAAAALASVLALGACGSGASPSGTGAATTAGNGQGTGQGTGANRFGGGQSGRGFPGVSGLVADVTGSTAQVQSKSSQTAVTWTRTTRFTAQSTTTVAHLRVGDCVSARPGRPAGTAGSTGTPVPSTSSRSTDVSTVAAATVEIFPATNGSCQPAGLAGGFGGGFGNGLGNRGRTAPNGGQPTGAPSTPPVGAGAQNGFGAQVRGAVGKVTALGTGSFTVAPEARRAANGATSTATSPVTVTYAATTTFTSLGSAAASAVKVGVCLSAFGRTDDTGAVTATAISVSRPVDGTCTTGPRPGGGAGRPGATSTGLPNA